MTERALSRSLRGRRSRRQEARAGTEKRRSDLTVAIVAGSVAFAALVGGSVWGAVHPHGAAHRLEQQGIAWSSALVLMIAGVIATRRAATVLGHVVAERTIRAAGVAVRLVSTMVGYVVVLFAALGLLSVSITHILTAGALTGVVVGIAAQQSLGNVFAGIVLLLARPFTIGDHIRVRSGALGGLFDGVVLGMSLTYVTMSTDDGLLKIPNSALLAAGVGPFRAKPTPAVSASVTGAVPVAAVPVTDAVPVTGAVPVTAVSMDPGPRLAAQVETEVRGSTAGGDAGGLDAVTPGSEEVDGSGVPPPSPWRELAKHEDRIEAADRTGRT